MFRTRFTDSLRRTALACVLIGLTTFTAARVVAEDSSAGRGLAPGVHAIEVAGAHNVFALGTNYFSGSAPEGDEGFAALEKLGVKTVITVDGAVPDVELAKRHGMRYVHLPHGYDGIGANTELMLAKAGRELEKPIYIHCHHGKHRGPTAAAIICMADLNWTSSQASAFLTAAGTATNYAGLYETVHAFKKPTDAQLRALPAEFPETAHVSDLVDAMVAIDSSWDELKAARAAGYTAPPDHPDLEPANEMVILWEHFREAQRLPATAKHGGDIVEQLKTAEARGREAERLLRAFATGPTQELQTKIDAAFDAVNESCTTCHKAHRNFGESHQ